MSLRKGVSVPTKNVNRCQSPYQKVWTGVGVSLQAGAKKCQRLYKKGVNRCGWVCLYRMVLKDASVSTKRCGQVCVSLQDGTERCQCVYQKVWTGVGMSLQDGTKRCQCLYRKVWTGVGVCLQMVLRGVSVSTRRCGQVSYLDSRWRPEEWPDGAAAKSS